MNWRCRFGLHRWRYFGETYRSEKGLALGHINRRECEKCGLKEEGNYSVFGPFEIVQSSASTAKEGVK